MSDTVSSPVTVVCESVNIAFSRRRDMRGKREHAPSPSCHNARLAHESLLTQLRNRKRKLGHEATGRCEHSHNIARSPSREHSGVNRDMALQNTCERTLLLRRRRAEVPGPGDVRGAVQELGCRAKRGLISAARRGWQCSLPPESQRYIYQPCSVGALIKGRDGTDVPAPSSR